MQNQSNFYDLMDHLIHYNANKTATGNYILEDLGIQIDVRMRSFYLILDTTRYCQPSRFMQKTYWRNNRIKCGLQLTPSSGKTYSYPDLRNYLKDTPNDNVLRANYYFICIDQIIKFFTFPEEDFGFEKIDLEFHNKN